MGLILSTNFKREVALSTSTPTRLVNIGGLAKGKLVQAPRNVLAYPRSVKSLNTRASSIDPVTGEQTLSGITVDFIDDGVVRALIVANRLIGKNLTVSLGFDTGSDATFAEVDYAPFMTGIISRFEAEPGIIRIICSDTRSAIWARLEGTRALLIGDVPGLTIPLSGQYFAEGCAPIALKQLLLDANIPASWISAATFAPGNCPATGHLVVDRRRIPGPENYHHWTSGATAEFPGLAISDRRIFDQKPASEHAKNILSVLRGHLLVQEGGLLEYREHDPAAASTFRFTKADIIPDSMKVGLDQSNVLTTAEIISFYETNHSGSNGSNFTAGNDHKVVLRDDDATAQSDWAWTDGTPKTASALKLVDDWFCSEIARDPHAAANILVGDTIITDVVRENDNFTGQGKNSPNAVSAALPMYLLLDGDYANNTSLLPAEIVKVTKVITNGDGSFQFGDGGNPCVRGMFSTTARQHGNKGGTFNGFTQLNSYVTMIDITPIARWADQSLRQFKDGAPTLEFKTPLHTYAVQVADVGNIESDVYVGFGLSSLAVGNATKWKVLSKDVDPEGNEITWKMIFLNNPSRTPSLPNTVTTGRAGAWGERTVLRPGTDRTLAGGFGATAGELTNHFTAGIPVATSVTLSYTIPEQVIASDVGQIVLQQRTMTATASKDSYLDARPLPGGLSSWWVTEVANGAAAPAIPAGAMRAFKIVSSGAAVTAVTDLRNKQSVDNANLKDHAVDGTKITTGPLVIPSSSVKVTGQMAALITNSDGMPYALIVDRDTTNLLKNPSFEVNATDDWTADANATLSRITTDKVFGTACAKLVRTATAGSFGFHSNGIATLAGANYYCFSGWLKADAGTPTVICQIQGFNGAIWVAEGQVNFGPTTAGWTRFFVTGNLPSATYSQVRASMTSTASVTFYADGLQIEESVRPSSYCDGDMGVGYSWSGTAHNSTSSRVGGTRDLGALEAQAPLSSTANSNPFVIYDNGAVEASSFGGVQFIGAGSAFPNVSTVGSLRDNDVFLRTDQGLLYYYNLALAQWLSVQEYVVPVPVYDRFAIGIAANSNPLVVNLPVSPSGSIYLTKWACTVFVNAPNTAASHWLISVINGPGATIDSFGTDSLGGSGAYLRTERNINSVRTVATDQWHRTSATKAGATATPGTLELFSTLHYRLIG